LIVPQVDFWVWSGDDEQTLMFYGLGKVGGTKGGRRYENWSIYGTVCVQFLTFYDWQAARAKNAKVLNPHHHSAKNFYANFHPPKRGGWKMGGTESPSIKWKTFTGIQRRHSVEEMFV